MKRLLNVVELTVPEQRAVIIALCALVAFVGLKTWRASVNYSRGDAPAIADQPSPSPGIRP